MKSLLTFIALFSFYTSVGQGMFCHLNAGYNFGCSFDAYQDSANYYSDTINGGIKYSINLGYKIDRNFSVDLLIQYQNATMPVAVLNRGHNFSQTLHANLLWILAGGTSHLPSKHFDFLIGTLVGIGLYNFRDLPVGMKNTPIRFAWALKGGIGYYFNKNIGFNIQTDVLFSTDALKKQFATPGLNNGNTGFSIISQFGLTAGITIQLFHGPGKTK
jgi:hypothetical protein